MRQLKAQRLLALYQHDVPLWQTGLYFAGMDEVGRGPLAGCVLAACVIMPEHPMIDGVDDSKRIAEPRREALYEEILRTALFVGIGRTEVEEIDEINILQATKQAMRRAAQGSGAQLYLIDALSGLGLAGEERGIIHGDATSYSIAAASIVAKVARDREMRALDAQYPQYGFARNKGYGTPEHLAALAQFGSCPQHRRSFLTKLLLP